MLPIITIHFIFSGKKNGLSYSYLKIINSNKIYNNPDENRDFFLKKIAINFLDFIKLTG